MKKALGILLTVTLLCSFCGCSFLRGEGIAKAGVFWYQESDVHLTDVREQLNRKLAAADIRYENYYAEGNQSMQIDQIRDAIAQGADLVLVNQVTAGSLETAADILAVAGDVPVIFFNRSIGPDIQTEAEFFRAHPSSCFIGTDAPMAGHMQGELIGTYLLEHYGETDINGDGLISYAMMKGDNADVSSIFRTQYSVEDANLLLQAAGKEGLVYFDPDTSEDRQYQADPEGAWSAEAAEGFMEENLRSCSEEQGNMIELVIANNDDMALGAIRALQSRGYNCKNGRYIPVFGVDATETGRELIRQGTMTGTILQDAEGMAEAISCTAAAVAGGTSPGDALGALEDPRFSLSEDCSSRLHVAYAPYLEN